MYFQYAKIQAYIADFRKQMNLPEWLISLERLIDGSKAGRARKPKGRGHKRSGQPDQQVRLPNLFTAALS